MPHAAKFAALGVVLAHAGAGEAQDQNPVVGSVERFLEQCSSAMSKPSAYFEEARSRGQQSPVAVARVPDEDIYWVLDMTPPGEMYVHIGEVSGRTRVYCNIGLFNVQEVRDAAATNETFLSWMDIQDGIERTGGPVDLKALMGGDEGMTGEQVGMTAQVYQHLIAGWTDTNAIASVAIQTGMIELDAEAILQTPLQIED